MTTAIASADNAHIEMVVSLDPDGNARRITAEEMQTTVLPGQLIEFDALSEYPTLRVCFYPTDSTHERPNTYAAKLAEFFSHDDAPGRYRGTVVFVATDRAHGVTLLTRAARAVMPVHLVDQLEAALASCAR